MKILSPQGVAPKMCLAAGNRTCGLGISGSFLTALELLTILVLSLCCALVTGQGPHLHTLSPAMAGSAPLAGWHPHLASSAWRVQRGLPPQGAVCFSEFLAQVGQALSLSVVTLFPQASVPWVACEAWPQYKSTLSTTRGHVPSASPRI